MPKTHPLPPLGIGVLIGAGVAGLLFAAELATCQPRSFEEARLQLYQEAVCIEETGRIAGCFRE